MDDVTNRAVKRWVYGRKLADFAEGEVYVHPWEVTISEGMVGLYEASFMDATPTYASKRFAQERGFVDRPVNPLLVMNLGLSFSVHDVSEQAIAHLAYVRLSFPHACEVGDTVYAMSKVLGAKTSSSGDKGVVHVRTLVVNQKDRVVCTFERKALIRSGTVEERPSVAAPERAALWDGLVGDLPRSPVGLMAKAVPRGSFAVRARDLNEGDVFCHAVGRTVGESEHMQLTTLFRNSHPLHFDGVYCQSGHSFTGARVVYGGLVLSWVTALASRDLCGHAVWDLQFHDGAHPNGVMSGDTLHAASKVVSVNRVHDDFSEVTYRLVGLKDAPPWELLEKGVDLFQAERDKVRADRIPSKVVEITRTVLTAH